MNNFFEAVQVFLEENREAYFEDLKELAQIPAPSGKEEARADWCLKWMERHGLQGAYIDEVLNVVFPFQVEGKEKITVINAHMDVVFPDMEPLPVREENGRLYGPGIGDDTANVIALLQMAEMAEKLKLNPKEGILFVCNSGEEGLGNLKGARKIMEDYQKKIVRWVAVDGRFHTYVNHAVGSKRYRITVRAEGGHSYGDFGNQNAICCMARLISEFYEVEAPAYGKTTYNVGKIEGGTTVNSIAETCSILYEYRSDDYRGLEAMDRIFGKILEAHKNDKFAIEVELLGERPCMIDTDLSELNHLMEEMGVIYGWKMEGRSGSTDCNIPLSMGIPAICFGVYEGGRSHTREEWIDMASTDTGREILARVICRIAGI
ncbi:MAG: M20/M25/M40 family metallo-hydrolase [Clostridiales bacterium]|nr:M20/M25/M40 family metallo-hydrolase [Clostridiales bacterium]